MALFRKTPTTNVARQAERDAAHERVFFQEVDDALRQDDALQLFQRYSVPVGAAILVLLAGLGGWMWYTNHQMAVNGERAEKFTIALDQVEANRFDTARATLDQLGQNSGVGYQSAARLVNAAILLEQHKADDAGRIYAAVAGDSAAPQAYRDLATVRDVASRFDKLPPQQVIDRLKPLAIPGSPWFGSAGEMLGVAYLKSGQDKQAGALFGSIARDPTVPESLRRRVGQLAGQLGVDTSPATVVRQVGGAPVLAH